MNHKNKLRSLYKQFKAAQPLMMGFPINCKPVDISQFYKFIVNNLGDPFGDSAYALNTLAMEREVVRFFADLYHLKRSEAWGYVTSCGSEGNLKGLALARERFPNAVFYFSEKSHYSVFNAVRLMGVEYHPIKVNPDHSINLDDLWVNINKYSHNNDYVISFNVGTTMNGTIDAVRTYFGDFHGWRKAHIHLDAALSGLILPFLDKINAIDFNLPIDSVAVSGHKMLGCAVPCGVFLTRKNYINGEDIQYTNSRNNTIFGSRSGLAPLAMWCSLKKYGRSGLRKLVDCCLRKAEYVEKKLKETCVRNCYGNTIIFPEPPKHIVKKYQLAVQKGFAHIIVMPHLRYKDLDNFVKDMRKEGY